MLREYEKSFSNLQKSVDFMGVLLFWGLAYYIRFELLPRGQGGLGPLFFKLGPMIGLLTLFTFYKNGLYKGQRFSSKSKEILGIVRGNTSAIILFVMLLYFFGAEKVSRLTIFIYFLISTVGLTLVRMVVRNYLRHLRRGGRNLRHILLVGNGEQLLEYIKASLHFKDSGIRFMGWVDSNGKASAHNIAELPEDFESVKKQQIPDGIVLSYQGEQSYKASQFIRNHYNDIIPIQLLPDLSYSMVGHEIEDFAGIPLLSVNQPTFSPLELFAKRVFELAGVIIGLVIISPVLILLGMGVKLSSKGPIFFSQNRVGLNGRKFKMWKFRSMKVSDSETETKEWSHNQNPRKTKFGQFLRRTSLDELPQLFNVLMGDMSLVGPRPEQPFFVDKFRHEIAGYMLKHKMRPGMTGWAQVNGWRGDTSIHQRIACDIYYIKHWSFWFDLKILFLTFWKAFMSQNAYY